MKKGESVRRKRATLKRGRPERLLWSDEEARAALMTAGEEESPSQNSV